MAKAKAKEKEKEQKGRKPVLPDGDPRTWTAAQRREAFLFSRKAIKSDYRLLDKDFREELISYNHFVFDKVLRLGGIARHGRFTQIHGNEGAGKTTTAFSVAAQYQKATGEPVAIFEYEPTVSVQYAYSFGVDPDLCHYEQPSNLQDAIKRHLELITKYGVRFFVDDSIPFMRMKVDLKDIMSGKAFKSNYGSDAKGISTFYKMLVPYMTQYDAAVFIVNQTRARIDPDAENASHYSYTNKEYSLPGGYMARFGPSVMLELILETEVKPWVWDKMPDKKEQWLLIQPMGSVLKNYPTANKVRVRTLKNKVTGGGYREAYIYIRPNFGIDEFMSVRELGCAYDLVNFDKKKWYVGKSLDDAVATYGSKTEIVEDLVIKQNPEVLGKLKGMVLEAVEVDETERFKGKGMTPEEEAFFSESGGKFEEEEDFTPDFEDGKKAEKVETIEELG